MEKQSFLFKYFLSMFMEIRTNGTPHVSIGRVMLGLSFLASMYIWLWEEKDIPNNMSIFLMASLLYIVGQKVVNTVKTGITSRIKPNSGPPPGAGDKE